MKILFQGDSITDGGRIKTNTWDLNHQMGHGYASIINSSLGTKHPDKMFTFINRGISGNRIADLYGRWKEDTLVHNPDIISVLIGINDVFFQLTEGIGSEYERFKKIYRLLLEEAKEQNKNVKFVLLEPFMLPVADKVDNFNEYMVYLEPLQKAVKEIAEEYNAVFVPLQEKFNELAEKYGADYWIWDGIHPTVCGHQIIADEWIEICKKTILSDIEN